MCIRDRNGVIPIVNENDTISVTELMFTDNDELSGMIASMMDMQALIILSNIDGIYNGSPSTPGTQVIREVEQGKDLSDYIQTEKSEMSIRDRYWINWLNGKIKNLECCFTGACTLCRAL